jgi:hypothetical protein
MKLATASGLPPRWAVSTWVMKNIAGRIMSMMAGKT